MDDEERMNLVLNTDFDMALLDCWEETQKADEAGKVEETPTPTEVRGAVNWESQKLPSFLIEPEIVQGLPGINSEELTKNPNTTSVAPPVTISATGASQTGASSSQQVLTAAEQQQAAISSGDVNSTQLHPLAIPSSASCPPHLHHATTMATIAAPTNVSTVSEQAPLPSFPVNASIQSLAFNAMAAGLDFGAHPMFSPSVLAGLPQAVATSTNATSASTVSSNTPKSSSTDCTKKEAAKTSNTNSIANKQHSASAAGVPPPFLLFDAPVELRTNFMQSQLAHGLPVMQDNNAYHYGMAVNGFHPQQRLGAGVAGNRNDQDVNVKLVDARHGDQGVKRIKNQKEQKRAQRITELIEELRVKMEKGGWKVGMKSKFHTLSSCADYVKHLIKFNKEKEKAVEKAKCDLEAKRQKIIEDVKNQQEPSGSESTTSTLTISSGSGSASSSNVKATSRTGSGGKRELATESKSDRKKPRLCSQESSGASSISSGQDDKHGVKNLSCRQTESSVSDITNSNKGSSLNSGSDERTTRRSSRHRSRNEDTASESSVSSDAAIASGKESTVQEVVHHKDVIIQGRKREFHKPEETTSLEACFELDYEEAFLKSNVPQLIATTSGRIVACTFFVGSVFFFGSCSASGNSPLFTPFHFETL